jgi:hypothetical protein
VYGRSFIPLLSTVAAFALAGCTELTLSWAELRPDGAPASPGVLDSFGEDPPVTDAEGFRARRAPLLKDALQAHVFGVMPEAGATRILSREVIHDAAFGGLGLLEEYRLEAILRFNGLVVASKETKAEPGFFMEVLLPKNATAPVPVILMETFCPRWEVIPDPAVAKPEDARDMGGGVLGGVAEYVFGRYICTPPIEEILAAGYAIATIYPGEFVPDRDEEGIAELRRLSAGRTDEATRWGAIAAWGFAYSRMVDALEKDARFDRNGFIVFGHSRYAKAALLAAAFDDRIDGVIAHQSGTGGASLNRDKPGESVKRITESYPHWFAPRYAAYAGREEEMPIDQHHLLALLAPRPVLLGNARRDVWSDPNGAFRAAIGADPAYELLGSEGLTVRRLDEFDAESDLAFWIRPGTHGVVKEDWLAFLEFLDAHFGKARRGTSPDIAGGR